MRTRRIDIDYKTSTPPQISDGNKVNPSDRYVTRCLSLVFETLTEAFYTLPSILGQFENIYTVQSIHELAKEERSEKYSKIDVIRGCLDILLFVWAKII